MNTRLQVEHPVTEAVTGLDLVRLQLLIAGRCTPPRRGPRRRGPRPASDTRSRPASTRRTPRRSGCPRPGRSQRFEIADGEARVRVDTGVESGSVVSPHYDPMLAKVIVHAPSRVEAAASPSPRPWPRAASTGSSPTATCWCGPCVTPRSWPARPTPASSSVTGSSGSPHRSPTTRPSRRHAVAAALAAQAVRRHERPGAAERAVRVPQQRCRGAGGGLRRPDAAPCRSGYAFDRRGRRALDPAESTASRVDSTAPRISPGRGRPLRRGRRHPLLPRRAGRRDVLRRRARRQLHPGRARAPPGRGRTGGRRLGARPDAGWCRAGGGRSGRRGRGRPAPRRARGDEDGARRPRRGRRHGGRRSRWPKATRSRPAGVLAVVDADHGRSDAGGEGR